MKKIKVLHLVEGLETGGRENVIASIARGINREKYDLEVWAVAYGGKVADDLRRDGIEVRVLNVTTYRNPFNIFKLASLIKKSSADIVHTHGYYASTLGRIAAKVSGAKVIINHVHSTYFEYKKRHIFMEKMLGSFTDRVICCSNAVEEFVRGYEGIKPSKTIVIYNGVDENKFVSGIDVPEKKKELNIKAGDSSVGIVASLVPNKGHKYLFLAADEILSRFPGVKFLVVGDGSYRGDLEEEAKRLRIDPEVIFTGTREDVPQVLAVMDIFVLPTCYREGLGLAVIEAMAAGKPVVASNIGGISEAVEEGVNGILVPPNDAKALANAVISLFEDKEKLVRMGNEGQRICREKFSAGEMVSKIEEVYESVLENI